MNVIEISDIWVHTPNSANGVGFEHDYKLVSPKEAKYITFTYVPYNSVNDPVACQISKQSQKALKITGPVLPNQTYNTEVEVAWYNSTICSAKVASVKIEYMDGTEETVSGEDISKQQEGIFYKQSIWNSQKCHYEYGSNSTITIFKHITHIADNAFFDTTTALIKLEEGSKLEHIGVNAFRKSNDYDSSFKELILPPTLKNIEAGAFQESWFLKRVYIPNDCKVAEGAFDKKIKVIRYEGSPANIIGNTKNESTTLIDKIKSLFKL